MNTLALAHFLLYLLSFGLVRLLSRWRGWLRLRSASNRRNMELSRRLCSLTGIETAISKIEDKIDYISIGNVSDIVKLSPL